MEIKVKIQTPIQERRLKRNQMILRAYRKTQSKYPDLSPFRIATNIANELGISYQTAYRVIKNGTN